MFEHLIAHWGYWAVGFGTLLEGEAVLLAAGAMAHRGLLSLKWVCLAAFLGTVLADQVWFFVGRRFGRSFLATRPKLAKHAGDVERWMTRYGNAFVVFVRFLYGLRTASLILLGASGYSHRTFALLDVLGAAVWAVVIGAAGWGLGATLKLMLGRPGHLEEVVVGAALVVLALCLVQRHRAKLARSGSP